MSNNKGKTSEEQKNAFPENLSHNLGTKTVLFRGVFFLIFSSWTKPPTYTVT